MKKISLFMLLLMFSKYVYSFREPNDITFNEAQSVLAILREHPLGQCEVYAPAKRVQRRNLRKNEIRHDSNDLKRYFSEVFEDPFSKGLVKVVGAAQGSFVDLSKLFLNSNQCPYESAQSFLKLMEGLVAKGKDAWCSAQDGPLFAQHMGQFFHRSQDARRKIFEKLANGKLEILSGGALLPLNLQDPMHVAAKTFLEKAADSINKVARVFLNGEELRLEEFTFVCRSKGLGGQRKGGFYAKDLDFRYADLDQKEGSSVSNYAALEQSNECAWIRKKRFPFVCVKTQDKQGFPIIETRLVKKPCISLSMNRIVGNVKEPLSSEGQGVTPLSQYQEKINEKLAKVGCDNFLINLNLFTGKRVSGQMLPFDSILLPEEKWNDPFVLSSIELLIEEIDVDYLEKMNAWYSFIELPHGPAYENVRLLSTAEGLASKAKAEVSDQIEKLKSKKEEKEKTLSLKIGIVPTIEEISDEESGATQEPAQDEEIAALSLEIQDLESLEAQLKEEHADIQRQREEAQQKLFAEWEAIRVCVSQGVDPARVTDQQKTGRKKKKKTSFAQPKREPEVQPKVQAKLTPEGKLASEKLKEEVETLGMRKDLNRAAINRTIDRIATMAEKQGRVEWKRQEGSGGHNVITLKLDEAGAQKLGVEALKFDLSGHGDCYKRGTFLKSILPDVRRILALEPKHLLESETRQ